MSKRCMGCMETYGDEIELCPSCGYVDILEAEIDNPTLTGYAFLCGDLTGDGMIKINDVGKLYQHVKGTNPMWTEPYTAYAKSR